MVFVDVYDESTTIEMRLIIQSIEKLKKKQR